jgi:hypothetical protein
MPTKAGVPKEDKTSRRLNITATLTVGVVLKFSRNFPGMINYKKRHEHANTGYSLHQIIVKNRPPL